jgi:flagellar hook-basal body complex protein FliE
MIESINNSIGAAAKIATGGGAPATAKSGPSAFDQILGKNLEDVNRLQQDATRAVEDAATGKTDDVAGVMTAVAKADLAFKTLLAIRNKLMEAYDEIKNMPV